MLPDVVLEANVGPSSMTVLPPGVGFRWVLLYVSMCSVYGSWNYQCMNTHILIYVRTVFWWTVVL